MRAGRAESCDDVAPVEATAACPAARGASGDFFLGLLQAFPALIRRCDSSGKCDYFNGAWLEFTGRALEQELGDGWTEGVHPDDAGHCLKTYLAALSGREEFELEYRLRRHDGAYRLIRDIGRPIFGLDGEFAGYLGTCFDVTETRQMQQALVEGERRYRRLFESHPLPIWVFDVDTLRFLAVNDAAVSRYGYSRDEFLALSVRDIRPAEDRPAFDQAVAGVAQGGAAEGVWRHLKRDGSVIEVEVMAHATEFGGRRAVIAAMQDITAKRAVQRAIARAKQEYDGLVACIPAGIYRYRTMAGGGHRFDYVSPRFCASSGVDAHALLECADRAFERVHPDDLDELRSLIGECSAACKPFFWQGRTLVAGEERWMQFEALPTRLENGDIVWNGVQTDITEHRRLEETLRRLHEAIEHSPVSVVITDTEGRIEHVNARLCELTGYAREELIGRNPRIWRSGQTPAETYAGLWQALKAGRTWSGELVNRKKSGELFVERLAAAPIRDPAGRLTGFVGVKEDITERKHLQQQVEFLTSFDPVTGLANRSSLLGRLDAALAGARAQRGAVAVFSIGLDQFKLVNESLGYDAGNHLLRRVAARLRACVRDGDIVSRHDGDRFVLASPMGDADDFAAALAQRLLHEITLPLEIDGHELALTCSIGVASFPADGGDAQTLLCNADAAMERAKAQGRHNVRRFTPEMSPRATNRLGHEAQLRRAVDREEFVLHYQPQVSLRSGTITGVEALIRWNHPERGIQSPLTFIPLAEECGLIEPIGDWTLHAAAAQLRAWHDAGLPVTRVAVNLSARVFRRGGLAQEVERVLRACGIEPRCLELELTESTMMLDAESAVELVRELKRLGVRMSMDDFGTGYSSLAYLSRFSLDTLKIDRSFVRDITTNPVNAAIATTTIAMAHNLGMNVIAEGVETEGQMNYLRRHHCDEMQGFHFSPPLPADDIARMLAGGKRLDFELPEAEEAENTLLLVDDEPNVLSALRRLLRRDGYRILSAGGAGEALDLLALHRVQVIVSDQRMPAMSGTEFLNKVKDLYPDTVRMVLSGYTEVGAITEAINRGAIYKFLTKPWDDDQLREHLRDAFRHVESRRRRS